MGRRANRCLLVGDSFSDNSHSAFDQWPVKVSVDVSFQNIAVSGDDIILEIEPTYATDVANRDPFVNFTIIQGGVNDLTKTTASAIQTATQSCIDSAVAAGLGVILVNVAPWGNNVNWTSARQTQTEAYNTWVAAQAAAQGITVVDIYTPLGDSGDATVLAAAYDSGDGLHLSEAGHAVMAGVMDAAITGFLESAVAQVMKKWRGAIEPAETGASGNEIQLWRGAIEPAATASSTADALIGGVTRFVTRGLTRGVTEGWSWGA